MQIPKSQGVLQAPTTETGLRPKSIAQSQILPNAISNFGSDIMNIAGQALQQERMQAQQEQESYEAMQALDFKNNLRSLDNSQKLSLEELPANPEIINNQKKSLIEERQNFFDQNIEKYGDNKRLQNILKKEYETSKVDFEYAVDKELLKKRKTYNTNVVYSNINSLKDRFDIAKTPEEFSQIIGDLDQTLKFGLATNSIDAKDIDRQQEVFKKIRKEREVELQKEAVFGQIIRGEIIVDPTNPTTKTLVDDNYNQQVLKGANALELGDSIATSTGVIPEQYKNNLTASVYNGNSNQKLESALTISEYLEDPKLQGQFNSSEKALALAISSRYDAGLPLDKIISYAENSIKENKSQDYEIRQARFEKDYAKSGEKFIETIDDIAKDIRGSTGFFMFGKAQVPDEMALQVKNLAQDYYLNEGLELKEAFKLAKSEIVGEWAVTSVGKKRFQRFAPEAFYPEGDWIQNQAIQEIRKTTIDPMPNIKNEIALQVIPETILTGQPSYQIFKQVEGQPIDYLRDFNNLPLTFKPDYSKTKEGKEYAEQTKLLTPEEVEKVRKKRIKSKAKKEAIEQTNESINRHLFLKGGMY